MAARKVERRQGKARETNEPYVRLVAEIPASLKKQLAKRAIDRDCSLAVLVEEALRESLKRR